MCLFRLQPYFPHNKNKKVKTDRQQCYQYVNIIAAGMNVCILSPQHHLLVPQYHFCYSQPKCVNNSLPCVYDLNTHGDDKINIHAISYLG